MRFDFPRPSRRRLVVAGGVIAVALAVVVGAVAVSGGDDDEPETVIVPTATREPSPTPAPTLEPQPTVVPVVPGTGVNDRIVIAKAKVDAPINLREVPPGGGVLPSPSGADDVVYYDFAAFPGLGGYPGAGGRIVLSGHVDYGRGPCKNGTVPPPCTAVFWDLTDLRPGDEIELRLSNGVHKYRVTGNDNLGASDQAKWDEVWQSGEGETIALITCGGDFNRQTREYTSRHVVYGERVES